MEKKKHRPGTKTRFVLFAVCAFVLVVIYALPIYFSVFECSMPFATCYHSWLELPLLVLLLLLVLLMSFLVFIAQFKNQKISKTAGLIYFLISLTGTATYFIYHLQYDGNPQKLSFNDWVTVKPFHIQLGILFFSGMILTNFITLF